MKQLLCTAVFGLCAAAVAVPPASASIILSLVSNPVGATLGGVSGFDYTYSVTLSQDEQLDKSVSPVFFTLYDFGAGTLVSNNLVNASSWAFTLNTNQAVSASNTAPNNNASIADVRAAYSGTVVNGTTLGGGQGDLGSFTVFTTNTGPFAVVNANQDAQLEKYAPGSSTNDTQSDNVAAVAVPTAARAIPEPATLALLGAGLAGLAFTRRRASAAL